MKRIMVLFTVVMVIIAAVVNSQDYTGNLENDPLHPKTIDDDFIIQQVTNGGVDSTLFVLNPTPAAADTEVSKIHYAKGYSFLMPGIVTAEAGSMGVRVIVESGYKNASGDFILAPTDSFEVTTANQDSVISQAISIPGGKYWRAILRTIDGCAYSQATEIELWFRRYR